SSLRSACCAVDAEPFPHPLTSLWNQRLLIILACALVSAAQRFAVFLARATQWGVARGAAPRPVLAATSASAASARAGHPAAPCSPSLHRPQPGCGGRKPLICAEPNVQEIPLSLGIAAKFLLAGFRKGSRAYQSQARGSQGTLPVPEGPTARQFVLAPRLL